MTRLDKCELLKSKGYTYDPETGKIFGVYGKLLNRKNKDGYIILTSRLFNGGLKGHHFAWYMIYGNVDFTTLDHINRDKKDNRIFNLRIVTHQQNQFNTNASGISFRKEREKWVSRIMVSGKRIHLGYFNTEQEARQSYLQAKEKYHII
jgi:hypothetical protein